MTSPAADVSPGQPDDAKGIPLVDQRTEICVPITLVRRDRAVAALAPQVAALKAEDKLDILGKDRLAEIDGISPDGEFWRCKRPDGSRRCFFAPPPST